MEPVYLSIQQKETGKRIKELLHHNGYTVKDIQEIMGFENPQAVYKWLSGKSLPSLDNFLILSKVLHTNIEDILVVDGDIVVFGARRYIYEKRMGMAVQALWEKNMSMKMESAVMILVTRSGIKY